MKIMMINSVCGIRSTGRICTDLAVMLEERGHEVKIAYGRESVPEQFAKYAVRIGSNWGVNLHGAKARLLDGSGFGSTAATKRFVRWIKEYDPDVIHLHNIHGYYLDIRVLFAYLRSCGKPILWSFYDCWTFTGHCAHFDFNGCEKWKSACGKCRHIDEYPRSFFDYSGRNYREKRKLFTGIPGLQIIAPSAWMASMVAQSYLREYPCHILPNGIDTDNFYPRDNRIRDRYGIGDRYLVVGVSSVWQKMKGIEYMNRLAEQLPKEAYRVFLVGRMPDGLEVSSEIIRMDATNSIDELCQIYSAADVFVNPTLQETQGLTTVEAFACGTPAVVFRSGGAAECVDESCGAAVPKGDFEALLQSVRDICESGASFSRGCIECAAAYSKQKRYEDFMKLYDMMGSCRNEVVF